jgi:hypothetical protein
MNEIYDRSLEELDGNRWGDGPPDATGLVERVHRLRTVKLRELSIEDIATLLGHREGPEWIVPLALDHLEDDPMAGAFYPGQLLTNVLLNRDYWDRFPRTWPALVDPTRPRLSPRWHRQGARRPGLAHVTFSDPD